MLQDNTFQFIRNDDGEVIIKARSRIIHAFMAHISGYNSFYSRNWKEHFWKPIDFNVYEADLYLEPAAFNRVGDIYDDNDEIHNFSFLRAVNLDIGMVHNTHLKLTNAAIDEFAFLISTETKNIMEGWKKLWEKE